MPNFKKTRGFNLRSGNKPNMSSFKMMGSTTPSPITSPILQVDWSKAPGVGTQERADWYDANNLAHDNTTKVKGNNKKEEKVEEPDAKETNVNETPAEGITGAVNNMELPKVNKVKTAASKIGGVLTGAFTGGLDAVYGTGKVLKGGEISFSKPKEKEKSLLDVEKDVDDKLN